MNKQFVLISKKEKVETCGDGFGLISQGKTSKIWVEDNHDEMDILDRRRFELSRKLLLL